MGHIQISRLSFILQKKTEIFISIFSIHLILFQATKLNDPEYHHVSIYRALLPQHKLIACIPLSFAFE
jgi:hypothetical protein